MIQTKNNVLVHCCCAVCAGYPLQLLSEEFNPVAYFYNPNLYPASEFDKRLDAMKTLCKFYNINLIVGDYEPDFYDKQMIDYKDYKEGSVRCLNCFEIRLRKTCEQAKKLGIEIFTSTLSVSPHKNFDAIKEIGENLANEFNMKFLDYNFKKKDGFLKTIKIAKNLNIYRQNYCGCKNSLPDLR